MKLRPFPELTLNTSTRPNKWALYCFKQIRNLNVKNST